LLVTVRFYKNIWRLENMRNLIVAAIASLFIVNAAFAADSGCEAKPVSKDRKPLAGAAKNSFVKKCAADAKK